MKTVSTSLLKLVLALSLVISGPVHFASASESKSSSAKENREISKAVDEALATTATQKLEGPNGAQADLSVSTIETNNEGRVLKEIVESANGPVVIFDNGENLEEIKEAIGELDLKDGQDVKIIEISPPDNRNWAQKFSGKIKQIGAKFKARLGGKKAALAATVILNMAVTGVAGGITYAYTQDLTASVGTAAALLTLSTLRMVFTDQWLKYLDFGGRALFKMSDQVTFFIDRMFNRSSSKIYEVRNKVYGHVYNSLPKEAVQIDTNKWVKAHEHSLDVTGSIMSAALAAATSYAGVLAINGSLHVTSLAAAFGVALLGAASAYDYIFFDVAGRYLYKADMISYKTYKWMLQTASIVAPSIDSLYIVAPQFTPARYVVIGLGVSGLVMAYRGEKVIRALNTAKTRAISSLNSYFAKRKKQTPCENALSPVDHKDNAA